MEETEETEVEETEEAEGAKGTEWAKGAYLFGSGRGEEQGVVRLGVHVEPEQT